MDVLPLGPFVASWLPWQRPSREWSLAVICKATFEILPGELRRASVQESFHEKDAYKERAGRRVPWAPTDRVPYKKRAEVFLVGRAYPPRNRSARQLAARLSVGRIERALETSAAHGYAFDGPLQLELPEIGPAEELVLEHLHPDHPRLETRLPGLQMYGFVERPQAAAQELSFALDTLWIDTERAICTLTWRGQVPVSRVDEAGRILVALADMREEPTLENARRLAEALLAPDEDDQTAMWKDPALEEVRRSLRAQRTETKTDVHVPSAAAPPPPPPAAIIPPPPPAPRRPARRPTPPVVREEPVDESTQTSLLALGASEPEPAPAPNWLAPPRSAPRPPPSTITGLPFVAEPSPAPPPAQEPPRPAARAPSRPPPPPPEPKAPTQGLSGQPSFAHAPAPTPASTPAREAPSPWAAHAVGSAAELSTQAARAPVAMPPDPLPPPEGRPQRPQRRASAEIVELLWFEPQALGRVRASFSAIVDELEFEPLDKKHDLPVDDPHATRDRHHAFGVLTRAEATDGRGVGRAMGDAIGAGGRFTPPLVVLSGELRFPLDEVEALRVTLAAVQPLVGDDKRLKEAVEAAAALAESPLLQGPQQVERQTRELREALAQTKRALPAGYLDTHVERVLLEQRKYQRRALFGDDQLRALFVPLGEQTAIPAYLPATLANRLPLVTKLRARLVAEANTQQDQYEAHPQALRVVVLGRVLAL